MRRVLIAIALLSSACTSTRMLQREGCWVKQTEKWPGRVSEELGFCTKPAPAWAQDRVARLVQECMAQADYRWENRALAAWTRGEPIPPQESDEQIARTCMSQASAALGPEAENAALKARLAELGQDREALRNVSENDREFLKQNSDKMVSALGEAAKKPAPSATATATSTGTAKSDPGPAAPTVVGIGMPSPSVTVAPVRVHTAPRSCAPPKKHTAGTADCDKPASDKPSADKTAVAEPPRAG